MVTIATLFNVAYILKLSLGKVKTTGGVGLNLSLRNKIDVACRMGNSGPSRTSVSSAICGLRGHIRRCDARTRTCRIKSGHVDVRVPNIDSTGGVLRRLKRPNSLCFVGRGSDRKGRGCSLATSKCALGGSVSRLGSASSVMLANARMGATSTKILGSSAAKGGGCKISLRLASRNTRGFGATARRTCGGGRSAVTVCCSNTLVDIPDMGTIVRGKGTRVSKGVSCRRTSGVTSAVHVNKLGLRLRRLDSRIINTRLKRSTLGNDLVTKTVNLTVMYMFVY